MNHARRSTQCTEPPRSSAESDRLVGAVINARYRVTARIGAGGMGKVYLAAQLPLDRPVALKILHVRSNGTEPGANLEKRFLREASVLSKLQHPNIVTVHDYGRIESETGETGEGERREARDRSSEQYFMAMEFLSGKTLAQRAAEGLMSISSVVRIARQIALGLGEAHAHGLVHRDLKPSNVMLTTGRDGEERIKIIDFGIVKLVGDSDAEEELTLDGSFIGSPKYMAPEQFLSAELDQRADIWAIGIVLYRLLTGKAPFEAENMGRLIYGVLNGPAPRVRDSRPDAPPQLDEIVARCLEKSPTRRFAAMADVAAALDSLHLPAPSIGLSASRRGGPAKTATEGEGSDRPSRGEIGSVSMVAGSRRARNGARMASLRQKWIPGVITVSLIAFAIALFARSVRAPAGSGRPPQDSAPAATVREPEPAAPEPASVLVSASAFPAPALAPALALPPKHVKASSRAKPSRQPKVSQDDDDIPALR